MTSCHSPFLFKGTELLVCFKMTFKRGGKKPPVPECFEELPLNLKLQNL